jgi:tryptophanyl-tRNA synthetase
MKYLCGIQPTGRLHVGHYLGVLKTALSLQEDGHVVELMVADLHANASPDQTIDELRLLGFRNVTSQSAPTALFASMLHYCPLGVLRSMTQFRSKGGDESNAMLLVYPVLMAADILNSRPDFVIVGEDQLQHVEMANDLYRRAGLSYRVRPLVSDCPRVMSIADPSRKMSKSLGDSHCVYLFERHLPKLSKAVTTPEGVASLGMMFSGFGVRLVAEEMAESKRALAERLDSLFPVSS